jgi:hypothetical protein
MGVVARSEHHNPQWAWAFFGLKMGELARRCHIYLRRQFPAGRRSLWPAPPNGHRHSMAYGVHICTSNTSCACVFPWLSTVDANVDMSAGLGAVIYINIGIDRPALAPCSLFSRGRVCARCPVFRFKTWWSGAQWVCGLATPIQKTQAMNQATPKPHPLPKRGKNDGHAPHQQRPLGVPGSTTGHHSQLLRQLHPSAVVFGRLQEREVAGWAAIFAAPKPGIEAVPMQRMAARH